jgi:Neprosin
MQTVECGWHIDITRYGDAEPHLFVFTTLRNYNDGQNFYNQEGDLFIPAQNPYVVPGVTRLLFSQTDGTQVAYRMGFYLTDGAWWFYFDDHPVGRYPLAVFGNGPIAHGATRIKFGGEVESRLTFWPPMGSGAHASAGYGRAASHRDALVYPTGGGALSADLREAGSVNGPCYTIDITNNSATDWGTYLTFGGPGGQAC